MAFHHQADQTLAFLRRLGEELLSRRLDRFGIGLDLDLRDRFDGHGDALLGIQILLWRNVERHELERQQAAILDHGQDHATAALYYARPAKTVNYQSFVRASLAIQLGEHGHE